LRLITFFFSKKVIPNFFIFLFAVVWLLQIAGNWREGEKRWHLAFCGANKINAVNLCVKKFFICSKI
jgi:hypothetical protein